MFASQKVECSNIDSFDTLCLGSLSLTSVGDNIRVQNKNRNAFICFLIGDTPMFSMSSTLVQDNSLHGLDCMNNNIDNVAFFYLQ